MRADTADSAACCEGDADSARVAPPEADAGSLVAEKRLDPLETQPSTQLDPPSSATLPVNDPCLGAVECLEPRSAGEPADNAVASQALELQNDLSPARARAALSSNQTCPDQQQLQEAQAQPGSPRKPGAKRSKTRRKQRGGRGTCARSASNSCDGPRQPQARSSSCAPMGRAGGEREEGATHERDGRAANHAGVAGVTCKPSGLRASSPSSAARPESRSLHPHQSAAAAEALAVPPQKSKAIQRARASSQEGAGAAGACRCACGPACASCCSGDAAVDPSVFLEAVEIGKMRAEAGSTPPACCDPEAGNAAVRPSPLWHGVSQGHKTM